ncbi:hypothetical protein LOZ39_002905 [Ophidiomyces ophidiicola]|uniref:uncharacterized protein n=1 Tax=Ophidiomyces ophidiicola TaxID=1387563 RepID=UPI0020C582D5|nr:uncharacterized protein LOZ57_001464 [Ophidiomyces ophidiicola]KAI1950915.1 hypothetical protein LOZ57_001464 [Ophidiomyces ophidiicola]KAI2001455.1 hypothetical protein LOZ49_006631 [Ophidiomyces ophidiicola]KAI2006102.1 hypothetical protein LOZ50_003343 [Ophidiomyces ophidiicola]KAI2022956.1 hypothetical protein LOZ46_001676 [Ophidiomyces ophidiicola]KAI2057740.1 hypothetical protein LOZ43_002935 [Ophidiomyces ophidiicola]
MKYTRQLLGGTALALFTGLASAFSGGWVAVQQELEIAAQMGLDPEVVFAGRKNNEASAFRLAAAAGPTAEFTEVPIDHKRPEKKYKNRFWVNEAHYKSGGPVFIFDGGEANAKRYADFYLVNQTSFFVQLLKEFGGMGIVWEHRYYGESNPFPVNLNTTAEQFQYLNNEQALADIPFFAKSFKRSAFPKDDLTPKSTPWVMVGGSYPGMRAAFTRDKYPDTIFAAFASSAPVQAQIDMSVYYEQVYRGMVAYGYGNCTKDIRAAYKYIDRELSRGDSAARIKKQFLGETAEKNNNGDFTQALIWTYATWQSYGANGGVGDFCNWLETDPETKKTAPEEGWAPTKGAKWVTDRFATWPKLVNRINAGFEINCKRENPNEPLDCDLGKRVAEPSGLAWTWQYCSEWGYFQYQNWPGHELLSNYQTDEYIQRYLCYRQFPDGLKSGHLPVRPKAHEVNKATRGWHMRPSNTYWSGGQYDPWRSLSPLSNEAWAPKIEFSTEIPECNKPTPQSKIFGYVIPNAEHCYDFRSSFRPGDVSRNLLRSALRKWLPCFKKKE